MSSRKDGRGHWPKGKRRKPPLPFSVAPILLRSFQRRGIRCTSRLTGFDSKTLRKWAKEETFPTLEQAERILNLDYVR